MKNGGGFTLVELIVVIAIFATLAAVATLSFNQWQKKYSIESEVNELLSDFSQVRMLAIETKREHRIFLNTNSYTIVRYDDTEDDAVKIPPTEAGSGGQVVNLKGQVLANRQYNKSLKYAIEQYTQDTGLRTAFDNTPIVINNRGYTSTLMTISVGLAVDAVPSTNCLAVSTTRINAGRIDSNAKDCRFN